jgi:uncharacterized phage-associated protein
MPTRMRFNEKKATQAAARFLRHSNGRMNYMKLIKLLYIADRDALMRWGRPITTDSYFSLKHGPVLSQVLDLITEEPNPVASKTFWSEHISDPEHYSVSLNADPSDDQLSEAEEEAIDEVFAKFGHLSQWQLVDLVHQFPEWQDPEGSRIRIEYEDILKAGNKTPEEIQAIEGELDALSRMEALLAGR